MQRHFIPININKDNEKSDSRAKYEQNVFELMNFIMPSITYNYLFINKLAVEWEAHSNVTNERTKRTLE